MEENLDKYAFWILDFMSSRFGDGAQYNCSACNFPIYIEKDFEEVIKNYNFCPHCGRTIIHQTYKEV